MRPENRNRQAETAGFDPERSAADFAVEFRRDKGLSPFGQHKDFVRVPQTLPGRPVDPLEPASTPENCSKWGSSVPGTGFR